MSSNPPSKVKQLAWKIQNLDLQWLEQAYALECLSYDSPWSRESFEHALGGGYQVIGAVAGRQLLGSIVFNRVADEVHILNVAVRPKVRGQGIGGKLLRTVHLQQMQLGAKKVILEVARSNQVAQKLYFGLGYRQIGRRQAYYHDSGDDALVLCKDL